MSALVILLAFAPFLMPKKQVLNYSVLETSAIVSAENRERVVEDRFFFHMH